MTQVVITEFMSDAHAAELENEYEVLNDPSLAVDRIRLLGVLAETEALVVRNKTLVDTELLTAAPNLKVVARLGVGLDNIDVDACEMSGVEVAPATGANAIAVAEYVIGALLHLIRGVFCQSQEILAGRWERDGSRGGELAGRRLGLIGLGVIAREVAARARAMGMEVVAHDPYLPTDDVAWEETESIELAQLLATSDLVSVHVPFTEATHHLIDTTAISSMKPDAVIVNTARGGVVDETALAVALREGRLGGAALDVFATEPVDETTLSLFRGLNNIVLTPHIAGITDESESRIGEITVANVRRHLGVGR